MLNISWQEDERREKEERLQQERIDEELAKKIAQEAPSSGDTVDKVRNNLTIIEILY